MPTGVYKRTEKHKQILRKSVYKAGVKSACVRKGKKLSEKHKKKLSAAYDYNKYVTPERNKKISQKLTGRKLSEEHCSNLSKRLKGRIQPQLMTKSAIAKRLKSIKRGKDSHFWRGGRTTLVRQIKNLKLYRDWRKAIFERDNYTCQICKKRGSIEICPDHIKPFSKILNDHRIKTKEEAIKCNELWDINNGRTLCHPCHRTTDTYGFKSARQQTIL